MGRERAGLDGPEPEEIAEDRASRVDLSRRALVNVLERQVESEAIRSNSRDTILEQFDSATAQGIEPRQAIGLVGSPSEGLLDFVFGPSQARAGILADEVEFEARRIRLDLPERTDGDSQIEPSESASANANDAGVFALPSEQPGGEFIATPPTPQIEPGTFTRPAPQTSDPVRSDEPTPEPLAPSTLRPAARRQPPVSPSTVQRQRLASELQGAFLGPADADLPVDTRVAAANGQIIVNDNRTHIGVQYKLDSNGRPPALARTGRADLP